MSIPLSRPDIGDAEEQAVLEVLRSGIVAMGPRTQAFEEAWAEYCGVRHAVFMANGTVAQEAVLRALDIGAGDEVITVSFTFNATASVILQVGAKPVFVDIREEDFGIDPDLVEAAITPRTKAIMPVHLYGLMPDMDPLVEIAQRHDLVIIEDAAQAHGARYKGRRAGQFGPTMFSLYATKNLMTGEGGFATTDDDLLADRMRLYRSHGMRQRYFHESLGTNFKPTDIAAALGLAQLPRLDERTEQRRRNAARLTAGLEGYLTPGVPDGREHVWHQYTMRFPGGERQQVIDGLTERGIGTLIYYPKPIHRQDYLQSYLPGAAEQSLPVSERLTEEVLSIPVRPSLTDDELDTIIRAVRDVATPVAELKTGAAEGDGGGDASDASSPAGRWDRGGSRAAGAEGDGGGEASTVGAGSPA
ncbi:MAG: DegT/DnrJ/EryC1/StrS family aminotransferase [Chloroflexi bacterium]|nr:DegT/DnrJ/EryC1/StrS family aminotransferase [Chloroflexota bacterium]